VCNPAPCSSLTDIVALDLSERSLQPRHFMGAAAAMWAHLGRLRWVDLSGNDALMEAFWAEVGAGRSLYGIEGLGVMHREVALTSGRQLSGDTRVLVCLCGVCVGLGHPASYSPAARDSHPQHAQLPHRSP